MKKISKIAAVFAAALTLYMSFTVMADGDVKVYVDNEQLTFDVNPIIEDGRTLVPLRAIFEALGAQVEWNGDTQTATAVLGTDVVTVTIDSNTLYKNGAAVKLDVPAKIVDDRMLVPVRAVSESFDADVEWDGDTRSVIITTSANAAASEKAELMDEDMETLKGMAATLRYDFEQYTLPRYVFENADSIYELLGDEDEFTSTAAWVWDGLATVYAVSVQYDSQTQYYVSAENISDDNIFDYYSDVIAEAGIDAASYIEASGGYESDNGTRLAVVVFKSADGMVDCKYIGIAASENGTPRYFTAENDYLDTDNWYVCEVTADGHSTIGTFEKSGDAETDIDNFAKIVFYMYDGDEEGVTATSV